MVAFSVPSRDRVQQILALRSCLPLVPQFNVGQPVKCGFGERAGVVIVTRPGHLASVTLEDGTISEELVYTGPPRARDRYGFYLVEITAATGGKSRSFWHESEMSARS